MDKKKIQFDVIIANDFSYSEDNGWDSTHLWPICSPDGKTISIDLEFKPETKNAMTDAEDELSKFINKNYPNKSYKIYYWWWK